MTEQAVPQIRNAAFFYLLLSLYLVLLAYFIMIVSISFAHQARTKGALQSVAQTFHASDGAMKITSSDAEGQRASNKGFLPEAQIRDAVQQLFMQFASPGSFKMSPEGHSLRVSFDASLFFWPESGSVRPYYQAFLQHLVQLATRKETRSTFQIVATLSAGTYYQPGDHPPLPYVQLGNILDVLLENHMPQEYIILGFTPNEAPTVNFTVNFGMRVS